MARPQLITLPTVVDERGALMFAEQAKHIPFPVKRIFAIFDVKHGARRGGHAHREQHQFIIMLSGECLLAIDNGRERSVIQLNSIAAGIHIPPFFWLDLSDFSPGSICLVLASGRYDEADYIRNFDEFTKLVQVLPET